MPQADALELLRVSGVRSVSLPGADVGVAERCQSLHKVPAKVVVQRIGGMTSRG